jgi:hypothetical protein
MRFHNLFLPIGYDYGHTVLCVDLRGGPLHGSIGIWDFVEAWDDAILWHSVTDMLMEVRNGLVQHHPTLMAYAARVLKRFARYDPGVGIWRSYVGQNGRIEWKHQEIYGPAA